MREQAIRRAIAALTEKFGAPVPPSRVPMLEALATLFAASTALCGGERQREAWFGRVAANVANVEDDAVLAGLPVDALAAAGMKTPADYAVLIATIYRNET